jgi:hypothetical protein
MVKGFSGCPFTLCHASEINLPAGPSLHRSSLVRCTEVLKVDNTPLSISGVLAQRHLVRSKMSIQAALVLAYRLGTQTLLNG